MQTRQGSFLLRSGDAFSYDNKEELRLKTLFQVVCTTRISSLFPTTLQRETHPF
jgi:hypothetical protein